MSAGNPSAEPDGIVRTAFDSLPERVCVLDREGTIVVANQTWNQSAIENGGSLSRCGLGVNYLRVCRASTGAFSERALEAASGIESVLRGAAPHFSLDYPSPSPTRKAWFRLIVRPLRRPHIGVVISHPEITSQVLLAQKIRHAEAHYGALAENPVDVATVLAAGGNIRYQSPASEAVLGIKPEELAGHAIFEFVHLDDVAAVRKLLRDCIDHPGRKHAAEYRFRGKDGAWRTLESIARKLRSDPGDGIILNSRDVTHRRIAEKALLAKQEALIRGREELLALAARLFREREAEHRRVATELNGGLIQRLAALTLQAAHLAARAPVPGQWQAVEDCVASLGRDLRQLSGDLYPAVLDHFGLAVALRDYCAEFTRRHGIPVNYVHRGISARFPVHATSTLYRIAEDVLANVAQHAHARRVWVTLSRANEGIRLAIRDDGAGFSPSAVEPGLGLGIVAMRERLRAVGGSLSISSRPGAGTKVVALAPLSPVGPP
jgi:PAS domain S-box-containing protein